LKSSRSSAPLSWSDGEDAVIRLPFGGSGQVVELYFDQLFMSVRVGKLDYRL
jgi:hypothetical protein